MPSPSTAGATSTSAKTSTAGASSGSSTREWASPLARRFLLRNRNAASKAEGNGGPSPQAKRAPTPYPNRHLKLATLATAGRLEAGTARNGAAQPTSASSRTKSALVALRDLTGPAHQSHALVQLVGVGVERCTRQHRITVDIGPAFFFDGFAHTRQGLRIVARVAAGRVNEVLVPVSPRQADIHRQGLLRLPRQFYQLRLGRIRLAGALGSERRIIGLGAALEMIDRILKRGHVKVGYPLKGRRGAAGLGRIVAQVICVRSQHFRLGLGRLAFCIGEFLHLVQIARYRLGKIVVARERNIGIGHAQNDAPYGLCERRRVSKAGIAETAIILVRVIGGMVDAAHLTFADEAQGQRGNSEMLEERGIV